MTHETRTEKQNGAGWPMLCGLLTVLGLYLVPFIVIVIDEKLLGTNWYYEHLPEWAVEVLRTIYPFYRLLPW